MSGQEAKKEEKKEGGGGGGPPSPMMIFGILLAAGAGIMLFLTLFGSGLANFGMDIAIFGVSFRVGKADFIQLLLYFLGVGGIVMWMVKSKAH